MALGEDPDWRVQADRRGKFHLPSGGFLGYPSSSSSFGSNSTGGSGMSPFSLGTLFGAPIGQARANFQNQGQGALGRLGSLVQGNAARAAAARQSQNEKEIAMRGMDIQRRLGQGKLANQRAAIHGVGWAQDPYLDTLGDKKIELQTILGNIDPKDPLYAANQNRLTLLQQEEDKYRKSKGGDQGGTMGQITKILDRLIQPRPAAPSTPAPASAPPVPPGPPIPRAMLGRTMPQR